MKCYTLKRLSKLPYARLGSNTKILSLSEFGAGSERYAFFGNLRTPRVECQINSKVIKLLSKLGYGSPYEFNLMRQIDASVNSRWGTREPWVNLRGHVLLTRIESVEDWYLVKLPRMFNGLSKGR